MNKTQTQEKTKNKQTKQNKTYTHKKHQAQNLENFTMNSNIITWQQFHRRD